MSQNNYFHSILDFIDEIFASRKDFGTRGWDTGLPSIDEILSFKKGFSTVVFSYSHQGKTQFTINSSVFLAKKYGVKTAFYLTEAGSRGEAVLDIIQTYYGKAAQDLTDEEVSDGIAWASKHFYIAYTEERLSDIVHLYSEVKRLQESGVDIQNVVIDHYHNLNRSDQTKFMDRADFTKFALQQVTRASKKLNLHTFILFHTRDTDPIKCPTSGKWYLPAPEPYSLSGGQQAYYLAQNMVAVWRPISRDDQYGVINPDTGAPYELNETYITCAKVKPKGSAKLGRRRIYFDVDKQQYYEVGATGRIYSNEGGPASTPTRVKRAWEDAEDVF